MIMTLPRRAVATVGTFELDKSLGFWEEIDDFNDRGLFYQRDSTEVRRTVPKGSDGPAATATGTWQGVAREDTKAGPAPANIRTRPESGRTDGVPGTESEVLLLRGQSCNKRADEEEEPVDGNAPKVRKGADRYWLGILG
ncbi:hypothetical protein CDEST_11991 [Colletotrichum destructivum]|uniref:Uncharacterized protein n=1 Tax=Colletotrichum destructivum TaxID=34406 RepID=A0AAX4IUS4_9PEZI|nr:hypothetical protein CDEST_11991 [Colletotrichum destructivum]